MDDKKNNLLEDVKKIHVPEPGTGEIVILPSVEGLHLWLRINHLRAVRWLGNTLEVTPVKQTEETPVEEQ